MKKLNTLCLLLIAILTYSCKKEKFDDPYNGLNVGLELPAGSFQANPEDLEIDPTVTVVGGANMSSTIMTAGPGDQLTGQISFNAPNGNVVAAGIRFGSTGPANFVPVNGAQGQTSGTLNFPMGISAQTCENLSAICHDIVCYEFAMTAEGRISSADIGTIALLCGNCDEPSCRDLIDPADCVDSNDFDSGEGYVNAGGTNYNFDAVGCNVSNSVIFASTTNPAVTFQLYNYQEGTNSLDDNTAAFLDASGTLYQSRSGSYTKNGDEVSFTGSFEEYGGSTITINGAGRCGF